MTQYRKKPVVIEAIQYEGDAPSLAAILAFTGSVGVVKGDDLQIMTLEGDMHASHGDWIICGVKGEFYPCKPDIFEATYERVEPADTTALEALGLDPSAR